LSTEKDDLEAVREISKILGPFSNDEREMVLRWVRERIGMEVSNKGNKGSAHELAHQTPAVTEAPESGKAVDIKTFMEGKNQHPTLNLLQRLPITISFRLLRKRIQSAKMSFLKP
jgi:hypothetical protein